MKHIDSLVYLDDYIDSMSVTCYGFLSYLFAFTKKRPDFHFSSGSAAPGTTEELYVNARTRWLCTR